MLKSELAATTKKIQVFERSIHSSFRIFARLGFKKQNMTRDQYHILEEWYNFLVSAHKSLTPNLIFYLRCSPSQALSRIANRSRSEESTISLEYVQELHEEHEDWLNNSRDLKYSHHVQLIAECDLPKKLGPSSGSVVDMLEDNAQVVIIDASKDMATVFSEIDYILQALLKKQYE